VCFTEGVFVSLTYSQLCSIAAGRKESSLPYAGEVFAHEVWEIVQQQPAYLVDVRTSPEWKFTGTPALEETKGKLLTLSWVNYPDFAANPHFLAELKTEITTIDMPIFFLCKTGGRSFQAANKVAEMGYTSCFNITHGFEGDHNEAGQRGCVNGWKAEAIAWKQP
jgi:rhodanese-related sulfurtransferase